MTNAKALIINVILTISSTGYAQTEKTFKCGQGVGEKWTLISDQSRKLCFRKAESFEYETKKFDEKKELGSCSSGGSEGTFHKIFFKEALTRDDGSRHCCEDLDPCDPENPSYQANVDEGKCTESSSGTCTVENQQTTSRRVAELQTIVVSEQISTTNEEGQPEFLRIEIHTQEPVAVNEENPGPPSADCTESGPPEEVNESYQAYTGHIDGVPQFESREFVGHIKQSYVCRETQMCGGSESVIQRPTFNDPGTRLYVLKFEEKMPSTCFDGHPFAYALGVTKCEDAAGAPITRTDRNNLAQIVRDSLENSTTTQRQLSNTEGNHPNFVLSPSALYLRRDAKNQDMWTVNKGLTPYTNLKTAPLGDQRRYIDAMAVPYIVYPSCFQPRETLREEILGDFAHVVGAQKIVTAVGGDYNSRSFTSQPEWSARLFELMGARQEMGCHFKSNNTDFKHNFLYVFQEGKLARGLTKDPVDRDHEKTYQGNQASLIQDIQKAQSRFTSQFSAQVLSQMADKLFSVQLDLNIQPTLFEKPATPQTQSTQNKPVVKPVKKPTKKPTKK